MCLKNLKKKKIEDRLLNELKKLNYKMNQNKMIDIAEILENPKKMFVRNFISGIFKGIGAGIGFSVITAIIIYGIQRIIKLNIPGISKYIADIVDIVKNSK